MINAELYDLTGKVAGKVTLPEEFFAAKDNPGLLAQAVRVFLSNQRSSKAKAKTRGEINLTKAKWFRQKGTGRARHGAKSAPIFVGGGVAHGPTGLENWQKKLPVKMRRLALASALTNKWQSREIQVVEGLEKLSGKTSELAKSLKSYLSTGKVLLVLPVHDEVTCRAGRNIAGLTIRPFSQLNAYEVLHAKHIVMTLAVVESLKKK